MQVLCDLSEHPEASVAFLGCPSALGSVLAPVSRACCESLRWGAVVVGLHFTVVSSPPEDSGCSQISLV